MGYETLADTALHYAHQYGTLRGNAYVALRWLRQGRIEEAAHLLERALEGPQSIQSAWEVQGSQRDLNALLRPSTGQIGAVGRQG